MSYMYLKFVSHSSLGEGESGESGERGKWERGVGRRDSGGGGTITACKTTLASFPGPRPASCRLQYGKFHVKVNISNPFLG